MTNKKDKEKENLKLKKIRWLFFMGFFLFNA